MSETNPYAPSVVTLVIAHLKSCMGEAHVLFEDMGTISPSGMNCLAEAVATYVAGNAAAEMQPIDEPRSLVERIMTLFEPSSAGTLKRIRDEAAHLRREVDTLIGYHVRELVAELAHRYHFRHATGDVEGIAGEFYPDYYDKWTAGFDPNEGSSLRAYLYKQVQPKALPAKVRRELGLLPPKGYKLTELNRVEEEKTRAHPVDSVWHQYRQHRLQRALAADPDVTEEMQRHYVDGRTLQALADERGQTRAGVFNRMHRAFARIRVRFEDAGLDPEQ